MSLTSAHKPELTEDSLSRRRLKALASVLLPILIVFFCSMYSCSSIGARISDVTRGTRGQRIGADGYSLVNFLREYYRLCNGKRSDIDEVWQRRSAQVRPWRHDGR